MLTNWWTTLTGIITGVGQYLMTVGAAPPHTRTDWASLWLGLGVVVLGVLAKDIVHGDRS